MSNNRPLFLGCRGGIAQITRAYRAGGFIYITHTLILGAWAGEEVHTTYRVDGGTEKSEWEAQLKFRRLLNAHNFPEESLKDFSQLLSHRCQIDEKHGIVHFKRSVSESSMPYIPPPPLPQKVFFVNKIMHNVRNQPFIDYIP